MHLSDLCKAYGNTERVRLIACLSRASTVGKLLAKCDLSQSALSQHLAVLRRAGIVTARRAGRHVTYKTASRAYVRLAEEIIRLTR